MRTLLAPALCFLLSACATLSIPATEGTGTSTTAPPAPGAAVDADVIRYTNDQRAANGLPRFVASLRLMDAARLHAQQMAQYQRMDHTISAAKYPTLQSRLEAVGYRYMNAAENVAWNSQTAKSVVIGWMNSPGHRANILDRDLTEIGVAMALSSKGEPYWIQVFGKPR